MADPFEQFKESDAAIEQARQAVEAQEAAENAIMIVNAKARYFFI